MKNRLFAGALLSLCLLTGPARATVNAVVNQAALSYLALSANTPPTVYGQPAVFSVYFSAPGSPPTGTVIFYVNGTNSFGTNVFVNGTSITNAFLPAGIDTVTAVYSGDANYSGQTAVTNHLVNPANTHNLLTTEAPGATSPNTSTYGQAVTLTTQVNSLSPGAGVPAGRVTFYDGGMILGTNGLDTNGIAVLTATNLSAGTHNLMSIYNGSMNYLASTSMVTTVVNQAALSHLALSANTPPTVYGQPAVFSVHFSAAGGPPTGTITFYVNSTNSFGTNVFVNGTSITNAFLPAGADTITAIYSGDANYTGQTAVTNHLVNPSGTTNWLSSSLNLDVFGQVVTLTAMVGAVAPGAGTPAGTVTFYSGATQLGTGTLTNGATSLPTDGLPAGTNNLQAVYAGSRNYQGSTSVFTQVVDRAVSSNTLTSAINPTVFGQAAEFTFTTASGVGTPTGTVTFYAGTNSFATNVLVSGETGVANAALPAGTNVITAVYSGDNDFTGDSVTNAQVVNPAGTLTTVATWLNPSVPGQPVIFMVSVSAVAPGAGTPGGAVRFYDGANAFGMAILTNGMVSAIATNLLAGTNEITAVYAGEANFLGGTSATLMQTVLSLTNAQILAVASVDHSSTHYLQTGLMQQNIAVSNVTAGDFTAVRITLHLTQAGIAVYNGTGTNANGDAYLQFNQTVPAHGSVTFTVEYYVVNRTTLPDPVISVTVTTAATPPAVPAGTPVTIVQSEMLPSNGVSGNAFLVGFLSRAGATYYVLYSSDMINWNVTLPAIQGSGTEIQWLDQGPPQTASPPSAGTQRFYKVIEAQ